MNIQDVKEILAAEIVCGEDYLESEVHSACGSDLMSDVLAFAKDRGLLLTGLNNPQVVRTAEMMDMVCVVFVRGKKPTAEVVALAKERHIAVLATPYRLFTACGLLYGAGLKGGCQENE